MRRILKLTDAEGEVIRRVSIAKIERIEIQPPHGNLWYTLALYDATGRLLATTQPGTFTEAMQNAARIAEAVQELTGRQFALSAIWEATREKVGACKSFSLQV